MLNRNLIPILFGFFVIFLTACSGDAKDDATVRAIKYIEVEETTAGQVRRISGVVESAESADLSFEVGGRVQSVMAKLGAKVGADEPLAKLDPSPYQLNVDAAKAELTKAQAVLVDKKTDYEAKAKLYEDRFVAKTTVDTAYADFQSAEQNVESAQAKLKLAQRDLDNTVLKAPYAGEVAKMAIDPSVNVTPGQVVMTLLGEGGLEVDMSIPENLRRNVKIGMPVTVTFPTLNNIRTQGEVTEIAARAGETNAFPTTVAIEPVEDVYPGVTAEVIFSFNPFGEELVFLIPAVAIAPSETEDESGFVFIFDPNTSTVNKTPVKARQMRGEMVEVTEGLAPGDIVAVAGVHFLRDGQKVKLYEEY